MKQTVWKALLGTALAVSLLTAPAQAHSMALDGITILPNSETQQFWDTWKYPLNDKGIYEHSADNWSFCAEFNSGLLLVQDTVSPTEEYATWDNYVDKKGQLHDLNRGRYNDMYSFSEGLAAVTGDSAQQNSIFNVGYIDTKGNEVIARNDNWCRFQYGTFPMMAGRFENGRAVVLRQPELPFNGFGTDNAQDTTTYNIYDPDRWYGVEYAYIDTQGRYLTNWMLTQDIDTVIALPLYDQDGLSLYQRVYGVDKTAPKPPIEPGEPEVEATYGLSSVKIKGYTIDEDYVGKMLIEVTNSGDAPDQGDLFYVTYCKFIQGSELIDAGSYVPYNLILQIPYEVKAGKTKTLAIPVGFLPNYDEELTGDQTANGWQDMENVESSRTVLAQAETPEEAAELAEFFKGAHDYGEMGLTYEPDEDGITILAKPMSIVERAQYLDQKLSAFTSQF